MTATRFDFDSDLTEWWLAAMGAPHERLSHGGSVAVVGTGGGDVAVRLARALPLATVSFFSEDPDEVHAAGHAAGEAGVARRCSFAVGQPEDTPMCGFDLICLIDVLGNAADRDVIVRRAARALAYDGTALVVEPAPKPWDDPDDTPSARYLRTVLLLARHGLSDVDVVANSERHVAVRARRAP